MKPIKLAFLLLLAATAAQAQGKTAQGLTAQPNQSDSDLTAETRRVFQMISANILKAAREMPESSYSFKPANDVRTFGDLIAHIAGVQENLCANINGNPIKPAAEKASKDTIVQALADSQSECQTAFEELSAENASKMVNTPAGQDTHLVALVYIMTHASEEYGQMGIYLRLNHLKPPTSDEPGEGRTGQSKL